MKSLIIKACCLVGLFFISACTTNNVKQQVSQVLAKSVPAAHYIEGVPFYPQQEYFCGPTTLSEVANYHQFDTNSNELAKKVFLPGRQGSLQIEMKAATRELGLVPYAKNSNLTELLQLVSQDIPVIILQNNGLSWYPQWHYAVVIGYDLPNSTVRLHTGLTANRDIPINLLLNTWQRAKNWLLAPMPPEQKLQHIDSRVYNNAANELVETNHKVAGRAALETSTRMWPDNWLSYFLLANSHIGSSLEKAQLWFEEGMPVAASQGAYLNNYAYVSAKLGNCAKANQLISAALEIDKNNKDFLDTKNDIEQSCSIN